MAEPTRLALVGCGGIAQAHIQAYQELWTRGCREFEVAACCDTLRKNAESSAAKIAQFQGRAPAVFGSLEELLAARAASAADVCLPHGYHHGAAVGLLEAGLDVLLEKPLGITIKASRRVIAAANQAGRILATAENTRRTPSSRAFRWAIREAGLIGKVRAVHVHDTQYQPFDLNNPALKWRCVKLITGGGLLMDSGAHFADMMMQLFGVPEEAYCLLYTHEPLLVKEIPGVGDARVDIEDAWHAVLRFQEGVNVTWSYGRTYHGKPLRFGLYYGEKGTIRDTGFVFHPFDQGGELTLPDGTVRDGAWIEQQYRATLSPEEEARLFPFGTRNAFAIEIYDFLRAVRTGSAVEMDGEAGLRVKALCETCYESAVAGRVLKYADVLEGRISRYQDPIDAHWGL